MFINGEHLLMKIEKNLKKKLMLCENLKKNL